MKTKFKDIIFISLIIGFFLYSFVTIVVYPAYSLSQRTEMEEISLVELSNGTVTHRTTIPPVPSFDQMYSAGVYNYLFRLPFAFLGFSLVVPWVSLFTMNFSGLLAFGFLPLFFVILANVSIPLTIKFSKGIPIWRRFFYVWFLVGVISLNGMEYWADFGR